MTATPLASVSFVESTGVQIVNYIPSNAYLVYGDSSQVAAVQALAATAAFVQWDGAYLDSYKIDPTVRPLGRPQGWRSGDGSYIKFKPKRRRKA